MSGFTSLRDLLPGITFGSDGEEDPEEEEEQEEEEHSKKPEEKSKLDISEIPVKKEEAEFWLPSEFLTEEEILMEDLKPTPPANYPFEFRQSSTELTESDEELDNALTELARQLTLHGGPKLIPLPSNRG